MISSGELSSRGFLSTSLSFRMAPPTCQNLGREGTDAPPPPHPPPPPPPPPPEAWQAVMAATNANTQMLLQLLQERNNQQQGNFNHGCHQFASLNQFLANQPKSFMSFDQPFDAKEWIRDMNKHFECSNVRPEDFVKFATFHLKGQATVWWQLLKDSRGGRMISWDDFFKDFTSHYIPSSFVEDMHEKFRRLKQGGSSMYKYNVEFHELARYALQDIRDQKRKIYQFRGLKQLCSKWRIRGSVLETQFLTLNSGGPEAAEILGVSSSSADSSFSDQWSWFFPPTQPSFPAEVSAAEARESSSAIPSAVRCHLSQVWAEGSLPQQVHLSAASSAPSSREASRQFYGEVQSLNLHHERLPKPLAVVSPEKHMSSSLVVPDVSVKMGDYAFLSSPIVLGNSDIDLILAMDWLAMNKASIDCEAKEVKLIHPSEDVIIFAARDDTVRLFSLNEKGEISPISQVPAVCEYEDVFSEELRGMPPHREVEFVIELELGIELVCKRSYKLGPEELKELKKQLDEQ
ncbi:hypothetical protein ZWY2020_024391 [Hordeum vulgare]|nr:hypothetical protein ZWY2020_024391 [Hordeum vulgare]